MAAIEARAKERRDAQQKELQTQRDNIQREWGEKLGELRQAVEKQHAVLAERETTAARAGLVLAEKAKDLDEKVHQRAVAEVRLQQLEADLERLSNTLLLDEFIKDRARTDDYRKQPRSLLSTATRGSCAIADIPSSSWRKLYIFWRLHGCSVARRPARPPARLDDGSRHRRYTPCSTRPAKRRLLEGFPPDAQPVGMLISTVAALSTVGPGSPERAHTDASPQCRLPRLIGQVPAIAAHTWRHSIGISVCLSGSTIWATSAIS